MAESEWMSAVLDSDFYPMTTANKLYNLICKTAEVESEKKKNHDNNLTPVPISPSVLTSAFKFLAYYNNNNITNNNNKNGQQRHKSSKSIIKTKSCLTVYSTPYKSRKTEVSTELPSYVKKMMENDASLRRLLKTGNVTISHIPHQGKDSEDTNSDIDTSTKKFTSYKHSERTSSRGSNLLKLFAKKASVEETLRWETPNQDTGGALDFKTAIDRLSLQTLSKPKLPGTFAFQKKKLKQRTKHRLNWRQEDEEEENGTTDIQYNRDNHFDVTKFLEVSFREEESDEQRRKYKCPHCVKKFCWSTDLKRHILTHTGERPFKCEYCSANFTRKFLMQKHARKHHQEQMTANSLLIEQNGASSNGHLDVINSDSKSGMIDYAVEVKTEDYEEMDDTYEADDDNQSGESSNSAENSRPIIINVFSSVNGNASMREKNSDISAHNTKNYSLTSRGINESILSRFTGNKKLNSNQTRKFSMLVNS